MYDVNHQTETTPEEIYAAALAAGAPAAVALDALGRWAAALAGEKTLPGGE